MAKQFYIAKHVCSNFGAPDLCARKKWKRNLKRAKREIAALSNYAGELEMRVNEGEKVAADLKRVEAELAASEKQHERATRDLSAAAQDVRRLAKYVKPRKYGRRFEARSRSCS